MRVFQVEDLVPEALLGKHVPINLLVLFIIGTALAIGFGLIAGTLVVALTAFISFSNTQAICQLKIIIE